MALSNFIPVVWSARILSNLHRAHVYGQAGVVNREYEGEIRDVGDTVKINSIGPVTIGNYTKNTNIGDPETLTDAQMTLLINQAKYFNFQVDDIDRAQQKPSVMDEAMKEASYGLRDVSDTFIASLYTGVAAGNVIGNDTTPVTPTSANAYDYLVDLGTLLDEANVPTEGRWSIVPPWFHGLLLKDDRFVGVGSASSDQVLRNGEIGTAAGFRVLKSNSVPNVAGAKYKIMAGHPMAISFAEQIVKVEGYRPEKRFADAVKGLHVYGAKVVRPTAFAVMTANRS